MAKNMGKKALVKKGEATKKDSGSMYLKTQGFSALQMTSGVSASMHVQSSVIGKKLPRDISIMEQKSAVSKDEKTGQETVQEFTIAVLEREEESKYGWGKLTPSCLQFLCSPRFLLLSLSLIAVAQGFFVHGILPSSWVPLHRQYHFTMVQLGVIRSMYDIGMILGFFPVEYLKRLGVKRPFWLCLGCIVMAFGAFICAVPYWSGDMYKVESKLHFCTPDLQLSENTSVDYNSSETHHRHDHHGHDHHCEKMKESTKPWMFWLGVALNGLGATAFFTMGIAYVDENVNHRTSVLYTGALNSALLAGVMIGFFVNAFLIREIWVNFPNKPPPQVTVADSSWVGSWWLGMCLAAALSAFSALPISGFPKRLPGAAKAHIQDAAESQSDSPNEKNPVEPATSGLKNVLNSIKACITNFTYLGMVIEQITYLMLVTSFASFMPVYLRTIYGVSGSDTRIMAGTVVTCGLIGSIGGTFLQLHLNTLGNLKFALITAWTTVAFLPALFVPCGNIFFAGATMSYPVNDSFLQKPAKAQGQWNLSATCNRLCDCDTDDFRPHCFVGPNPEYPKKKFTIFYYSPCYAGCLHEKNSTNFTDCKCVPKYKNGTTFVGGGRLDEDSTCKDEQHKCWYRAAAAMVGFCMCALLIFVRLNSMQHALVRCIPSRDRVVGLTMCAVVSRIFGSIPAPIFMGFLLDGACIMQKDDCQEALECVWRAEGDLAIKTGIAAFLTCLAGALGLSVAYYDFKRQTMKAQEKEKGNKSPVEKKSVREGATEKSVKDSGKKSVKEALSAKNSGRVMSKK